MGSSSELTEVTLFYVNHVSSEHVLVFDWIAGLCQVNLIQKRPSAEFISLIYKPLKIYGKRHIKCVFSTTPYFY